LSNQILHWDKKSGNISTVAIPKNDSTIIKKAAAYMPGVDGALICGPDIGVDASNNLYLYISAFHLTFRPTRWRTTTSM